MLLRPTAKLLKVIGKPWSGQLAEAPHADDDWYGNLVWIDGRKCVLLTHAGTLFSVFIPDVSVADLRPPGQFLVDHVAAALESESLPMWTFGKLDADSVRLAKTADRSTLGCMNDQVFTIEFEIEDDGGLESCDIARLNHRLHRYIHLKQDEYPIDLARARLARTEE